MARCAWFICVTVTKPFSGRILQKDKGSGAVVRAVFGQLSPKLLASINALYVYACTGQGKAAMKNHATACTCIRLAVRDKDFLFSAADSTRFSSMIIMSEVSTIRIVHPKDFLRLVYESGAWQLPSACAACRRIYIAHCCIMPHMAWS